MIQIENLIKHYDGGLVKALNGVFLTISQGEFCAITGSSGCGKSTLLNLIASFDTPTSGTITINGQPLKDHRPLSDYRNRLVGFIFQLHNLIPNLTLVENIEIPMYANQTISRKLRRQKAMDLLSEVDLSKRASFLPTQISGGERQRAAVARALANDPQLLLADEPTGSVDSLTAEFIMESILRRCKQQGMTILLVTHDAQISARADRVLPMRDGQLTSADLHI